MNLALIGYGKMGKEVEGVANEKGIRIVKILTRENNIGGRGITADSMIGVDVCIDFSSPAAAIDTIKAVAANGTNIIVGTTGWYERLDEVKEIVASTNVGVLYASNFSLGVNIFLRVVKDAARVLNSYPEYDVAISEVHHNKKVDSPSGTALSLGSAVLENVRRKTELHVDSAHGKIEPHQLHVTSTRLGSVTGTHHVVFDSDCDTIELIHAAKNRRGFAVGAVLAAGWLKGKKGLYTMQDVILP